MTIPALSEVTNKEFQHTRNAKFDVLKLSSCLKLTRNFVFWNKRVSIMMLRLSNGLYHMISSRVAPILVVALGQFVAPAVWHKLLRFSLPQNKEHASNQ